MKTLAVKLEDGVHARLVVLAGLTGSTLGELLKQAAEKFAEEAGTSPEFVAKAEQMLRSLDRETRERKEAIQALLQPQSKKPKASPSAAKSARKGNGAS